MKNSTTVSKILMAAFWLLVWQVLAVFVDKEILLPSPYLTFLRIVELFGTGGFYLDILATVSRCACGIALSFVFGVFTAILAYRASLVRLMLSFPLAVFKSTPVVGVILFLILLLASGHVPVCVCFLMCYPVVYTNVLSGLDRLGREELEMVKMYRVQGRAILRHLYIPSIMPEITASLNLIAGLSWKTVVTAEIFAVPSYSMGYNLLYAKSYLETSLLFAWIIAIVALSIAFEKVIQKCVKGLAPREYAGSRLIKADSAPSEIKYNNAAPSGADVELTDIYKSFEGKPIFGGANYRFAGGKVTIATGPSGAGKTTMLRMIAGLEPFDSGEIHGTDGQRISFMFQEDRLLPWLNLYDNIAIVLKAKLPAGEIDREIRKILDILSLSDSVFMLPPQLSGGMKRRAALARALLYPADLLLLDEPYKGLDQELKHRVAPQLSEYFSGKTVIFITHDPEEEEKFADATVQLIT